MTPVGLARSRWRLVLKGPSTTGASSVAWSASGGRWAPVLIPIASRPRTVCPSSPAAGSHGACPRRGAAVGLRLGCVERPAGRAPPHPAPVPPRRQPALPEPHRHGHRTRLGVVRPPRQGAAPDEAAAATGRPAGYLANRDKERVTKNLLRRLQNLGVVVEVKAA